MIREILKDIGLSDYETRVYVALIELGKATSGEILQKSGLNTGKIYDILGYLKNKGFISEVIESGVRKFYPANPEGIFDYLENKKKDIFDNEKNLKKIIPELLNKINKNKESQRVEVFYGFEGLKTAHKKELKNYSPGETLRVLGIMKREEYPKEIYNFFINNLYSKRIESKLVIKKILDADAKKYRKDHEVTAKIRYFPYVSPVAIMTIKELTIIDIVTDNPITITIESKEVAESFIQQFELLWKISK